MISVLAFRAKSYHIAAVMILTLLVSACGAPSSTPGTGAGATGSPADGDTGATGSPGTAAGATDRGGAKPQSLVFTSYGGQFEEATRASIVPCFEQRTGITAELLVGNSPDWLARLSADPANPPFHVFLGVQDSTWEAIENGLVRQIDTSKIPEIEEVPSQWYDQFDGYAVGFNSGGWGLAYRTDIIEDPPTSWREFVERTIAGDFGRNVAMPTVPSRPEQTVWRTIHAYDMELDEAGLDFAFETLSDMRPSISRFWENLAEPGTLLESGEAAITPWNDGRANAFIAGGAENIAFQRLDEGSTMSTVDMMIPVNASDYAYDWMSCALDADVQSAFGAAFPGYLMANENTEYPEANREQLPAQEDLVVVPFQELNTISGELVDRWNRWIAER